LSTDGIQRGDFGSKGRYVLRRNGAEAEITFSVTTPTLIIADHTEVAAARRGTGAGAELVAFMVTDMRARGAKVMPPCPFVNAERKKQPEGADAFAA
jgi:predicted GNAT family acetyltransferase